MTNAQMHADAAVRQKNVTMHETKAEFKLKRFQNVNPRTSTKRGDEGYMVNARRIASTGDIHENQWIIATKAMVRQWTNKMP